METKRCVFAATHLDWKGNRRKQARFINRWFQNHVAGYAKPVFLCGDMNSLPGSDAILELEKKWERLSPEGVTFPGGGKCIDYIFRLRSSAPATVLKAEILDKGTESMSDHYPVLVKVKIQ